jgi:chromosome partitioning protein
MKTIAVINQKGGVGKSTTALAIGAGLILKGYRVLFIDLDAQGNLTYTLEASTEGYNALGVLQRPETVKEEIQHTEQGDVIASSPSLSEADTLIVQTGKEYRLKEALETVAVEYDYCIIDTPPALGILTINALTACNGVIIPAQADLFSLQGISQLNSTIEVVQKYCNPALSIMGIVITRFNGRSIIRREVAEILEQTAKQLHTKLYKARIRECIALVEAQVTRQSIYKYAPKSNATADYKALVDEILEEE